jgi:nucleotide-binding universal stress UspA family protein
MDDYSTDSFHFRNILHLTDFSTGSDRALNWAIGVARANVATLSVLHVLVPDMLTRLIPDSPSAAFGLHQKRADWGMRRIEEQVADFPHQTIIARGDDVCSVVESRLKELGSDLIVLGTHGRKGLKKLLLGSVAERILRRSPVPVMTVGPGVVEEPEMDGKVHRVLFATDFAAGTAEAAEYAITLARRDQAQLVLLHACKGGKRTKLDKFSEPSVAEALHRLDELVRQGDKFQRRPETLVEFGDAGTRILEIAKQRKADLIVMGICRSGSTFAATHLEVGTTHNVVAHASCPVLTVRPRLRCAA